MPKSYDYKDDRGGQHISNYNGEYASDWMEEDDNRMVIITINVPYHYLKFLHKLVYAKVYPSRSEACRVAIRDFVHKEMKINKVIKNVKVEDLIQKINDTDTAVCLENGDGTIETHKIIKRLDY